MTDNTGRVSAAASRVPRVCCRLPHVDGPTRDAMSRYSPFLGTLADYRCSCGQRYVYDCDEAFGAWWERVDEEGRRDG